MAKAGYSVVTTTAVGLTANTAKTVLGVKSNAAFGVDLRKISIGLNGVVASEPPVLVELVYVTFATNPPGTNSTSRTPSQTYGRTAASGVTAASAWTAEPTVITVLEQWYLTPNGGLMVIEYAPDHGYDTALGEGLAIRCTPGATITGTVAATLEFERS